ncbi:MAG: NAD-dependent epimerase/dehydratase family protein [Bacteroidales bacterium]|nr:NAD-dependent epimerase/dehydratase family protein [Bacteroidales bacterium]
MTIAVTGANGHVGSNLCRALKAQGHHVRALTHHHTTAIRDLDLECIQGDLLDPSSLPALLQGVDGCFHLAASISIQGDQSGMVWKINAEGTRNMVNCALEMQTPRFIHFSSIHALQQHPIDQGIDETRPLVENKGLAYDKSKAEGERIVMHAVNQGLQAIILRPTAIIGPADPEPSLTGKAVLQLLNHQIPALIPGGYDWVDVRDVVDVAVKAISKGTIGESYLISGRWASLKELSGLISQISARKTPGVVMPMWLAHVGLPFISLYSRLAGVPPLYRKETLQIIAEGNRNISHEKAHRDFGYVPRPLEQTIGDLLDWFEERQNTTTFIQ